MFGLGNRRTAQAIVILLVLAGGAYAYFTGPDRGYTGAPGDNGNCTACHDTFLPDTGAGSLALGGNPSIYQPGQAYTVTVSLQDPTARRWGFELTAIDSNGNRAGTFAPLGGDTQIATTGMPILDRQYIEHTSAGTFPGTPAGHTWRVQWTAPSPDMGTVRFYVAGNAANNDGQNGGDYIYTNSAVSESPSSSVAVAFVSRPDGLTLAAGSQYSITWSATNTSNVDSYEIRYSTDDGASFPITNRIFTTMDPSATSFQWTVPNTPTTQARIRVQAATKSGSAVNALSGQFTITGSGSGATPVITSAQASGKKLFVFGNNFQMGAVVQVNGADQKTANLDDFSHQLICKKAARFIDAGSMVNLVVVNPDGTTSAPFSFTKPS